MKCPAINDKPEPGVECGELNCLAFSSEVAAFQHLLKSEPQVLGIGESHAPKGIEGVHSAARRFGELLLPALCGRSHSIVLELWLPRNDCGDNRVQQVKKAQEPVTRTQAKSNQDDYVTLGHVAKRLGISPQYVNDIIARNRDISGKVAALLGWQKPETERKCHLISGRKINIYNTCRRD